MEKEKPLLRRSLKQRAKEETWIYALAHPITKEVRYIGQTCRSIEYRLYEHTRAARKGETWPVMRWIRKLLSNGLQPVAMELEHIPVGELWREAEIRWIAKFREYSSNRLLNATDGGDGTRGYCMSYETRKKISDIAKRQGRRPPSNKGKTFDEEYRKKLSDAHKGKPGTPWTPEHKAKYLASRKYEPWSEEMRKKCLDGRKKYTTTEDHRKSLSIAASMAWARLKAEGFKTSESERAARRLKRKLKKAELISEASISE